MEHAGNWLIWADGLSLEPEEVLVFTVGEIRKFPVSAMVEVTEGMEVCAPSNDRGRRAALIGYGYDINAEIRSLTVTDGEDGQISGLSVLDFGLLAYTYDYVWQGLWREANFHIAARVRLQFSRKEPKTPFFSTLEHHWRIERIYTVGPEKRESRAKHGCYEPELREVQHIQVNSFWREEPDWPPKDSVTVLLECKKLSV